MIGRITATAIVLLLALYAFDAGVLGGGHVFNPSGIAFLLLATAIWFRWDAIRGVFRAVMDESNIPIIRLGAAIIGGMRRLPRVHRPSDEAG